MTNVISTLDWPYICRVCLGTGELSSIFEYDRKSVMFCEKIMLCANIQIKRDSNFPRHICDRCITELDIAIRFRSMCEKSDKLLRSMVRNESELEGVKTTIDSNEIDQSERIDSPKTISEYLNFDETSNDGHNNKIESDHMIGMKYEINNEIYINSNSPVSRLEYKTNVDEVDPNFDEQIYNINDSEPDCDQPLLNTFNNCDDSNTISNMLTDEHEVELNYIYVESEDESTSQVIEQPIDSQEKPGKGKKNRSKKSDKSGPLFQCEYCFKSFKHNNTLKVHLRRHLNDKPFGCDKCDSCFVNKSDLHRHYRIHTGEKPYACSYCDRTFSETGAKVKHERTHTGEKPYQCQICGKRFALSHTLSKHMLKHTGIKQYECDMCGKTFKLLHHLKYHTKIHFK